MNISSGINQQIEKNTSDEQDIVYRNIWLGNTYYNFCHSRNVLNIRPLGFAEAVVQRCSIKNVLLEILQDLQKNTCVRVSFFNKVAG